MLATTVKRKLSVIVHLIKIKYVFSIQKWLFLLQINNKHTSDSFMLFFAAPYLDRIQNVKETKNANRLLSLRFVLPHKLKPDKWGWCCRADKRGFSKVKLTGSAGLVNSYWWGRCFLIFGRRKYGFLHLINDWLKDHMTLYIETSDCQYHKYLISNIREEI